MNKIVHRRDTCRACNSKELDLVFQLNPTPIGDAYVPKEKTGIVQESYPIDLFICKKCCLAQITDIIDPAVLYGEYIYVTGSSFGLSDHFNGYAKGVISNSASSRSGDRQQIAAQYKDTQYVQIRSTEKISLREKITNIRTEHGVAIWTELNFPANTPTVFEIIGTTPMTDPFGDVLAWNTTLKRSENQVIGL